MQAGRRSRPAIPEDTIMATFQKAVRSKAKIRLSIDGPSGSGKTHSALLLAGGLAESGKIFLIDTERDSATLGGCPRMPLVRCSG